MDPVTAGIIAGGVGGIGGQLLQNQANSAQAQRQMDFQRNMADSAHQREVNDLRLAGLNPILSALGSGAAVPGGAMAEMGNLGEGISKGADTAIAVRAQNKALDLQDADIDLKHDQATNLATQRVDIGQDIKLKNQYVAQEALKTNILKQTANSAIKKAKAEGDFATVNQLMGVINSGASSAAKIKDTFNPLSGIIKMKGTK